MAQRIIREAWVDVENNRNEILVTRTGNENREDSNGATTNQTMLELSESQLRPQEGTPLHSHKKASSNNTFLYYFLNILRDIGMIPHELNGNQRVKPLQKFLFVLANSIATIQAIDFLKYQLLLEDYEENKLRYYVFLGYAINNFLFRAYFIYLVCCKQQAIMGLCKIMREWTSNTPAHIQNNLIFPVVIFCLTTSVAAAFLLPLVFMGSSTEWNFSDMVSHRSYGFLITIFLWQPRNHTDLMTTFFVKNTTSREVIMAVAGWTSDIFGYLQENLIKDVSLMSALTMHHFSSSFAVLLNNDSSFTEDNIRIEIHANIWKKYKLLRMFNKYLDATFGMLLQLLHFDNLLFCAYFLFLNVISGEVQLSSVIMLFQVFKLIAFYIVAAKASSVNTSFREWVHEVFPGLYTTFRLGPHSFLSTTTVLDQLSNEPLGVGSNLFFIDKAFIWKFISVVGSYFLFFKRSADGEE